MATVSIESALWDSIILSICRLTENRSSKNTERATLGLLSPKNIKYTNRETGRKVKKSIKEAVELTEPIRDIRVARIAHMEFDVAIKQRKVDKVSRAQIEAAVSAVSKPMSQIYDGEIGVHLIDGPPVGSSDSAVKLLNSIYLGTKFDRTTIDRSNYPDWLVLGKWDR